MNLTRFRRGVKIGFCLLLIVWLGGNFGYRGVISYRVRSFEDSIAWDRHGVHSQANEISVGSADARQAILLVHGINDTPEVWDRFAPELAGKGYFVRVLRLPGFGERVAEYAKYDRHAWIEKVVSELADLENRFKDVTLVGHSLGGAVTFGVVRQRPELVDRLVLLAPGIEVANDRSPILPVRTWQRIGSVLAPFVDITESPFGPDSLDPQSRELASRSRFVPRHVIDELFLLMDENMADAKKVGVLTLMVLANEDHVVDNAAAKRLFAQLTNAKNELVELDGSAHMIQRDYRWRDVVELTAEFTKLDTDK